MAKQLPQVLGVFKQLARCSAVQLGAFEQSITLTLVATLLTVWKAKLMFPLVKAVDKAAVRTFVTFVFADSFTGTPTLATAPEE